MVGCCCGEDGEVVIVVDDGRTEAVLWVAKIEEVLQAVFDLQHGKD
jgi:hypothetical protein